MGPRDDGARPRIGEPADHAEAGHAPSSAGTRIGARVLAAAGEVNRYYAQRMAEYQQSAWPALDEVHSPQHDERG